MIHLKCTVVHYANLNSSILKLWVVEYAISFFFSFIIYVYFNEAFVKKLSNNYHFLTQISISKIHLKMYYNKEY